MKAILALPILLALTARFVFAAPLDDAKESFAQRRYEQAVNQFLPVANAGNVEAQRLLGEMIFRGQGVNADPNAAAVWTKLAAEGNDSIAQYNLGYMFENGFGVARSDNEALRWYRRAAEGRNVLAYRRLGDWYLSSDSDEAMRWYDLARLAGDQVSEKKFAELSVIDQRRREESREAMLRENAREQRAIREAQTRERQESQRAFSNALASDLGKLQQQQATQAARIDAASKGTTVEAEQERAAREAIFAARVPPAEPKRELGTSGVTAKRTDSGSHSAARDYSDERKMPTLTRTDADERVAVQEADRLRRAADGKKRDAETRAAALEQKRQAQQAAADAEVRQAQMCRAAPMGTCGCWKYQGGPKGNACSK